MIYAVFPGVSDIGQVWGWGYGGEGQLGLGSRIRMVSSPHPVPCVDSSSSAKDRPMTLSRGGLTSDGQGFRVPGSYVKGIACGGRHSAVITGNPFSSPCFFWDFIDYNFKWGTKIPGSTKKKGCKSGSLHGGYAG